MCVLSTPLPLFDREVKFSDETFLRAALRCSRFSEDIVDLAFQKSLEEDFFL